LELLNFAFNLGVVFAIFGFLWGIIQLGYTLLRIGKTKLNGEEYLVKTVKYFLLVEVTFNFSEKTTLYNSTINQLIITALILLTYFIGKLQKQQNKKVLFQMVAQGFPKVETPFNLKAEIAVILFSLFIFTGFIFFPQYAKNPLSNWFLVSIENLENAAIFGFVFKLIGFVLLMNMIMEMVNALTILISGKPLKQYNKTQNQNKENEEDTSKFDDFEELE